MTEESMAIYSLWILRGTSPAQDDNKGNGCPIRRGMTILFPVIFVLDTNIQQQYGFITHGFPLALRLAGMTEESKMS